VIVLEHQTGVFEHALLAADVEIDQYVLYRQQL
jgi:hypothetical protein